MRRGRRGSNALEFALVLPVLLALLAGVVDLGQYLLLTESVVNAVAEGARAGALATATAAASTASQVATTSWQTTELPGTLTVGAATSGTKPHRRLTVTGTLPYTPWFGILHLPAVITYDHTLQLVDQR